MVGENAHVSSGSSDVNLGHICGSEDCLVSSSETLDTKQTEVGKVDANLVGKNERQFYLVSGLCVATASQWDGFWCASSSRGKESEGGHYWW